MLPLTPAAILLAGVFVRFLVHFCKRNLRIRKIAPMIRRWIVPVFFVSGILANGIDAAVLYHQAQNESVSRLMFDAARIARQENRSIFLYNPPERLEGSANFYLHKNLPEYSDYLQEPRNRNSGLSAVKTSISGSRMETSTGFFECRNVFQHFLKNFQTGKLQMIKKMSV